jgi:hypothetical protein
LSSPRRLDLRQLHPLPGVQGLRDSIGNGQARKVRHAGTVKLLINPMGKAARKLARRHKLRIKLKLTYKPRGGITSARHKNLKLVKRR